MFNFIQKILAVITNKKNIFSDNLRKRRRKCWLFAQTPAFADKELTFCRCSSAPLSTHRPHTPLLSGLKHSAKIKINISQFGGTRLCPLRYSNFFAERLRRRRWNLRSQSTLNILQIFIVLNNCSSELNRRRFFRRRNKNFFVRIVAAVFGSGHMVLITQKKNYLSWSKFTQISFNIGLLILLILDF